MKIKWGALVTDGRGKLGGHVASKNRTGSYLRTKVTPVNPQTSFQSDIRALFGNFSNMWSGLTAAQRESFDSSVSDWSSTDIFGDIKNPTGKNLFTRLNINLGNVGLTSVLTAPSKGENSGVQSNSAVIDIPSGEIDFGFNLGLATERILISATPPLSAGTGFFKGKYRNIYHCAGNAYSISDCYDAYVSRFGVPVSGDNISLGFKVISANGQNTVFKTVTVTYAP